MLKVSYVLLPIFYIYTNLKVFSQLLESSSNKIIPLQM